MQLIAAVIMRQDVRGFWPVSVIRSLEPKARWNAGRAREWRAVSGFGFSFGDKGMRA